MSPSRRTSGTLGALALAGGLAVGAPPAHAATHDVTSGSASTLTLGSAFRSSLKAQGVRLTVARPATLKGTRLRLPVTRSTTTSSTTTLTHSGTLALRKGTRSTRLTSFRTVVRGSTATVTAVVAKKRRTVFAISGGRPTRDRATGAVRVAGGTVRLSSAAVGPLRTALRAPRLRAGVVGRLAVTVRPAPAAKPPTATPPAPTTPAPAPTPTTPTPAPSPAPAPAPEPTPTTPTVPTTPTTPTEPTTPTDPPPLSLTCAAADGAFATGASWAVKTSFLSYLQGPIAKGQIGCTAGATGERTAEKVTTLRLASTATGGYHAGTGAVDIALGGSMRFAGHDYGKGPLLDLGFANLRIRSTNGQTGELVADVTSAPFGGMDTTTAPPPAETKTDQVIATLNLASATVTTATDGRRTWSGVATTLTDPAGVAAFGGFYSGDDGRVMAPLTFTAQPSATSPRPCPSPLPAREVVTEKVGDGTWTLPTSWTGYLLSPPAGCIVGTAGAGTTTPARPRRCRATRSPARRRTTPASGPSPRRGR